MSTKTITTNPITRLEGHGKIEIFLNERALRLKYDRYALPGIHVRTRDEMAK